MNSEQSKLLLSIIVLAVIVALVCFLVYKAMRIALKHKIDTITAFTGGLGSGKTLLSTRLALKLYRKNVWKYYTKKKLWNSCLNLFRRQKNKVAFCVEKPKLYSNIPILLDKKKRVFCDRLDINILLLQERMPLHSVILIDEIGSFASQFDYKEKNVIKVFDEFVRFFRHYSQNGYMVVNDQCSENINLVIRRRINKVNNLSNCLVLWRFVFYYQRYINVSEEIKTIDTSELQTNKNDTQDNMNFKISFLWNKNIYDSLCYSHRYSYVPKEKTDNDNFNALKTDKVLTCPKDKEHLYEPRTPR